MASAHKEFGGRGHSSDVFRSYLLRKGLNINSSPESQGGIVWKNGVAVGWFRGPSWRKIYGNERITVSDIKPIFTENNPSFKVPNTGAELELNVITPDGELAYAADPDHPVHEALLHHNGNGNGVEFHEEDGFETLDGDDKNVGFSPELGRYCIELNFAPGHDTAKRNAKLLYALRKFTKLADENGVMVNPLSVVPHREITPEDTNQHPYVQRIAMEFMGWDRVRHFTGSSFQTHVELLNLEDGLKTINLYEMITPMLLAPTLAGPFMNGSANPHLHDEYKNVPDISSDDLKRRTYENLNGDSFQSFRYLGRFFGSPSGGTMRDTVPENPQEFWKKAEEQLNTNKSPTVGRVTGHHANFRIRPDLGPHGTIELAVMDTSGARVERLVAMQEMTRVIGWKLQLISHFGKIEELKKRYPALFGKTPTADVYETVHWNNIEVSRYGTRAKVIGIDDKTYPVSELWDQALEFVQEPLNAPVIGVVYSGLPPKIIDELRRAYGDPSEQFRSFPDKSGITSAKGFYETGMGNLSEWMIQRYSDLIAAGMSETDAIKNCSVDVSRSFHSYILGRTVADINSLYEE